MTDTNIEGGCFCGRIRYVLTSVPVHSTVCHCADCRRAVGAQSVAWVTVAVEDFSIVQGEPKRVTSSAHVVRTFCDHCGTSLTYRHDTQSSGIDVTTGSLDHPELCPPTKDIFCRDKLAWVKTETEDAHY